MSTASRSAESLSAGLQGAIAVDAPTSVRDALASLGRTEDVRFSPSGRRLAIASYARAAIAVADVEITATAGGPAVAVTRLDLLGSPVLREPHGLDFVDEGTLVVADRATGLHVFRVGAAEAGVERLTPVDGAGQRVGQAPGSVVARPLGDGSHEVLTCENWTDVINRHVLAADGRFEDNRVVAAKWLDLPDGLAVSKDGERLAVSNHNTHGVFVFAYPSDGGADPIGVLRGVNYPHGVRFAHEDRCLVVADAGAPYLHVFCSENGWRGAAYPAATIEVMEEETFARGRHNPKEGGPKGIDVDTRTNVVAVTAECLPLAFVDLGAVLDGLDAFRPDGDALVRYELDALAEVLAEVDEHAATARNARDQLAAMERTKIWRLTRPARRAYGAMRRAVSGPSR